MDCFSNLHSVIVKKFVGGWFDRVPALPGYLQIIISLLHFQFGLKKK
jgi:hypothetical protein